MVHNLLIRGEFFTADHDSSNMIEGFDQGELAATHLANQDSSIYDASSPSDDHAFIHEIPSEDLMNFASGQLSGSDLRFEDVESLENFMKNGTSMNILRPSNIFPTLEEHDQAGLSFELMLNPNIMGKGSWYYSSKLDKVFIRMDQTFYIQVVYLSRPGSENINLRAMMVFLDDIGLPVIRCNNHKVLDPSIEAIMESVIRSENSDAVYEGTASGKNVGDRLSVLIPLSVGVQPDEKNYIKQSIALKFVCQNSCIGRRPTAVIFTLENKNGEVLGKRSVNVKICSCPKRDKEKEETKANELKRTASEANIPYGKKVAKVLKIKEEPDVTLSSPQPEPDNSTSNPDEVSLLFRMPDAESMNFMINMGFSHITKLMALDPNNPKYIEYFKLYKNLLDQQNEYKKKST